MTPHAQGRIAGLLEAAGIADDTSPWRGAGHDRLIVQRAVSSSRAVIASAIRSLAEKEAPAGLTPLERELLGVLKDVARQKLSSEISLDESCDADFVGAYDWMIEKARAALSKSGQKERQP